MNEGIQVSEPGAMKLDSKGNDIEDNRRLEQRAKEMNGPVVTRKMTAEERKQYGLPPERRWLFYCGTQAADWLEVMCEMCVHGSTTIDECPCKTEEAVHIGFIVGDDNNPVPDDLIDRPGYHRCYDCKRFTPKPCEQCGGEMDTQRTPYICHKCAGEDKGPGYQL